MAFGDVFAGWMGEATKHYQNLLQMDYQNKRDIATQYSKIAEDPRYDEETQAEAQKRSLEMLTFQPMQKPPKEYTNFTFTRTPPTPAPVQMPGTTPPPGAAQQQPNTPSPTPGAPGVQNPPVDAPAGPSDSMWGPTQTVQPPTPPPYTANMAPMPYNQQMERLRAKTQAETKFPPIKVSDVKSIDDDGQVWNYAQYAGINPSTGIYGTWSIKSDQPVAYAPRAALGAVLNVDDEQKLRNAGLKGVINSPSAAQIEQIRQIVPGARLVHTGYGEGYYIASPTYKNENLSGQNVQVLTNPPAGQPMAGAQATGQATSTLPKTTAAQQQVQMPGGKIGRATFTKTQTTQTPGPSFIPGTPIPSLGQQQPAAGQVPPPTAPPSSSNGGVTPIPGAGRGLSAEQITTNAARLGVMGTTLGRGANVLNSFDRVIAKNELDSFLKRVQFQIVSNPANASGFEMVVSNKSELTPEESQFAADYASLGEDINIVRVLTNQVSRGEQAYQVLLSQRGNLLGNPDVFKKTLLNTLRTISTQVGPMNRQLLESNYQTPLSQDIYNGYKAVFGSDKKALETALRQDHWVK